MNYHAGLTAIDKDLRPKKLEPSGEPRVIVATNAFGMGIDKADVKARGAHGSSPFARGIYFQRRPGGAGRDGKQAYAVLLYNRGDRTESSCGAFPEISRP